MGQVTKMSNKVKSEGFGQKKSDFSGGRTVERKRERRREPSAFFENLRSFIDRNSSSQE